MLLMIGRVEKINAPSLDKLPTGLLGQAEKQQCDLSGLSRYLETRHQCCDLGRPNNVPVPKRDEEEA